jgi:hypothetical protein
MKKIFLFVSTIIFLANNVYSQEMSINLTNLIPTVKLNETRGEITVSVCNVSGGSTDLPIGKARPLISFPPNTSSVVLNSVTPAGGMTVFSNNGTDIRLTNAVTLAPATCFEVVLGYTGSSLGEGGVVTGTLAWNGPPPVGEFNPGNNNSVTTINVRDAAAPVTLTSFTVDEFSNGNLLDWKIKDESGFSHFSVRKSTNLSEFWEIGTVKGGNKNGKFDFLDKNFNEGINYYQLKMVDLDGSYKLSKIISIENRGEFGSSTVYPNPSPNRVFKLKNSEEFDEINLMTNEGTRLPVEVRKIDGTYEIKVSESYSAGSYFLQFVNSSRIIRRKVVLL